MSDTLTCRACDEEKFKGLFTDCEKAKRHPRCMTCVSKRNKNYRIVGPSAKQPFNRPIPFFFRGGTR